MRKFTCFAATLLLGSFFTVKAQTTDTTATVVVVEEDAPSLTISGYVDVYYTYNFNKPPHSNGLAVQNVGRVFDIKHNQFSLGLAQTKFDYTKGKLNGVIDLTFGPNAELGNFGNIYGSMISIKQAYMAYKFTKKLTFTVGQFGTHVGYELIDAPLNYNYSLSYLFGNGPFYHTGAKASYQFSDKFAIMGGIVNGWDELLDFNKNKSYIAQAYISPVEDLSIYVNYIGGDEKNGLSFPTITNLPENAKTTSHLFDLTSTYQISDAFKIGLNAAYGTGKLLMNAEDTTKFDNASWYGAALYLNYGFTDHFGLGLRAEHFNDKDGVRYLGAGQYNELTLTADIKFKDGAFNLKPEFRIDIAKDEIFTKYNSDGAATGTSQFQPTLGMAAMYKF